MQQSNSYVILFTLAMTVIIGGLLAFTNQALKPAQTKAIELDTKGQILNAVMDLGKGDDILAIYDDRIKSLVVDIDGTEVTTNEDGEPIVAEKVNIGKNYKREYKDRLYPVFKFMNETDPNKVEAYILPVYGAGLWNSIWGFVALDKNLVEIVGISFGHAGETPGLGARIASPEIQNRFVGKEIFDEKGNLMSVRMVKGESGGGEASIEAFEGKPHQVDGLSGATLTAYGVNDMLARYLDYYQKYFNKVKNPGV